MYKIIKNMFYNIACVIHSTAFNIWLLGVSSLESKPLERLEKILVFVRHHFPLGPRGRKMGLFYLSSKGEKIRIEIANSGEKLDPFDTSLCDILCK